jgi:hypothetical protein
MTADQPPSPGDEAPPNAEGAGENICPRCGGDGRDQDGSRCEQCGGSGRVTEAIGGG